MSSMVSWSLRLLFLRVQSSHRWVGGLLVLLLVSAQPLWFAEGWRFELYTYCLNHLGTVAAWIHSKIGIVGARTAFAYLQSAGMGGYGAAAVNGAVQVFGAVSAGAVSVYSYFNSTGSASTASDSADSAT